MEDYYDDPVLGRLELKRNNDPHHATGYVDINKKKLSGGNWGYYAKTRLNLNNSKQTRLPGECYKKAREAAIYLATYLKMNPPVPKVSGSKKAGAIPF